ncbi:MAG: ComEC/Rec2 family competence protein [Paracoccaceae bacterium]
MGWVTGVLAVQRGHLFPWLAVGLAMGIGLYFSLRFEPDAMMLGATAAFAVFSFVLAHFLRFGTGPLWMLAGMVALGVLLASGRAHMVSGPVLDWHYYGGIEGRVVGLDRSASDAVRITLDQVVLSNVSPKKTPTRVRVSMHGDAALGVVPQPGMRIMTTGHLSPPGGPVEPGGFDFQRHAWFLKLGGVGYTRVPVLSVAPPDKGWSLWVFRMRMAISGHVRTLLPDDVGGFAAAVTTGDRSGMSPQALDNLRAANTAHLLAISGLHMGLLSGFIFGLLRIVFAFIPPVALRWPTRKLAAGGALIAAAFYLSLSGGSVSTERAFVMAAVALVAIMLDRRALSLRSVAIAALIVLTLRPEALLSPGFQMSFAATAALVAVFQHLRGVDLSFGLPLVAGTFGVLISSAVAGLATAPIGAAHFNAVSHYGLIANLVSVPLMGIIVIPAAVLAAVLAPFGLEFLGLWAMGVGLRLILDVSHWVAALDGARSFVPGPGPEVLPLLCFGAVFMILWRGRTRWIGVVPVIAAIAIWTQVDRPGVLIADQGNLVGVMTEEGRALSKPKGAGFIAKNWLENDGERVAQEDAATRWPKEGAFMGDVNVVHLNGKRAIAAFGRCATDQVIIASTALDLENCVVIDPDKLSQSGALALMTGPDGIYIRSVRDVTGTRHWSQWPKQKTQPGWWAKLRFAKDSGLKR